MSFLNGVDLLILNRTSLPSYSAHGETEEANSRKRGKTNLSHHSQIDVLSGRLIATIISGIFATISRVFVGHFLLGKCR
jgi:hypothetical protein